MEVSGLKSLVWGTSPQISGGGFLPGIWRTQTGGKSNSAPVAHVVEHLIRNQEVTGSSPVRGFKKVSLSMQKLHQKTRMVVESVIHSTTCNKCGRTEIVGDSSLEYQDLHTFVASGGYGSSFPPDTTTIRFELCGKCLKKLVSEFFHPPERLGMFEEPVVKATYTETQEEVSYAYGTVERLDSKFKHHAPDEKPENAPQGGVWKHYKGGLYEVLEVVWDPLPGDWFVAYRSLNGEEKTWLRPLSMWGERVAEGPYGLRFTPITQILDSEKPL